MSLGELLFSLQLCFVSTVQARWEMVMQRRRQKAHKDLFDYRDYSSMSLGELLLCFFSTAMEDVPKNISALILLWKRKSDGDVVYCDWNREAVEDRGRQKEKSGSWIGPRSTNEKAKRKTRTDINDRRSQEAEEDRDQGGQWKSTTFEEHDSTPSMTGQWGLDFYDRVICTVFSCGELWVLFCV